MTGLSRLLTLVYQGVYSRKALARRPQIETLLILLLRRFGPSLGPSSVVILSCIAQFPYIFIIGYKLELCPKFSRISICLILDSNYLNKFFADEEFLLFWNSCFVFIIWLSSLTDCLFKHCSEPTNFLLHPVYVCTYVNTLFHCHFFF